MMRNVLITGGLGYVGGRVAQQLSADGWHVRIATRGSNTAAPAWLPQAEMCSVDWSSEVSLRKACAGMNRVVHMAALNEHQCMADPVAALEVNGVYSVRLLQAALAEKVSRFVYLSTAHVYGAPLQGVLTESANARPIHPYASSHRAAEDIVLAAHQRGLIEGVVFRLSNGFGPPAHAAVERWTLLVNDLCRQAVETGRLKLQSAGLQRRDFITLHDAARAVGHMLDLPTERLDDGLFNLGGNWAPQIIEMALRIQAACERVLGYSIPLDRPEPGPDQTDMPLSYEIRKLLATGFALNGDIDAELDATVTLCRDSFRRQT